MIETQTATRVPVHNREWEAFVIGAVAFTFENDPIRKDAYKTFIEYKDRIEPDISAIFFDSVYKGYAKAILSLHNQGVTPDILTLPSEFERLGLITPQTPTYTYDLTTACESVSSTKIDWYLDKLIELYLKRVSAKTTEQITDNSYQSKYSLIEIIDQTKQLLNTLQKGIPSTQKLITPENIYDERIADLTKRRTNKRYLTGFPSVDKLIAEGFAPGLITIIAGPKSSGKTAYKDNILIHQCDEQKLVVYDAVPEMLAVGEMDRIQSIMTGIPIIDLKRLREWNEKDTRADLLITNLEYIEKNWKLYIDGARGINLPTYFTRIENLMNQIGKIDVVYIDTMTTLPDVSACRSDKEKFGELINSIEIFADRTQIHFVLLAHFNNYIKHRKDHTPDTSDLDFGAIYEEKAHNIYFTMRKYIFDKEEEDNDMTIWIAKQRDGPTGKIEMEWIKETGRIVDPLQNDKPKTEKKTINFNLDGI